MFFSLTSEQSESSFQIRLVARQVPETRQILVRTRRQGVHGPFTMDRPVHSPGVLRSHAGYSDFHILANRSSILVEEANCRFLGIFRALERRGCDYTAGELGCSPARSTEALIQTKGDVPEIPF
jgi:hypothetical protein